MTEPFDEIPQTAEDGSAPFEPPTSQDPAAGGLPSQSAAPEPVASDEPGSPAGSDAAQETPAAPTADPIGELTAVVTQLVTESEKYHARAAHRETVIDNLHAEAEKLRTGERRGTVRPLLMSVARIRDDLMRQAADLPGDFDAVRAQKLLQSFADSIEIVLDDYGVSTTTPAVGDEFDARRHKAVSSTPTADVTRVKTIASVRRDGYRDVETGVSLKQAEVVVYVEASVPVTEPAAADPVPAPGPPVAEAADAAVAGAADAAVAGAADAAVAGAADAAVAGAADERPTAEAPKAAAPMSDSAASAPAFPQAPITPADESRLAGNAESNNAEVIRKD